MVGGGGGVGVLNVYDCHWTDIVYHTLAGVYLRVKYRRLVVEFVLSYIEEQY